MHCETSKVAKILSNANTAYACSGRSGSRHLSVVHSLLHVLRRNVLKRRSARDRLFVSKRFNSKQMPTSRVNPT